MKKIYSVVAVLALGVGAMAQSSNKVAGTLPENIHATSSQSPVIVHPAPGPQAIGDTVFVFDGYYVYDWNSTLPSTFSLATEDLDGAQVAGPLQTSAFGPTSDFVFFYSIDPTSNLHYAHPDTVFFGGATSWFNPVGQADNWLEMGPITVPATGGTLKWRHNMPENNNFRDGYQVLVSTTGMTSVDFSNAPIFTVTDNANSTLGDTVNTPYNVFYQRYADVSAYAGQDIYVAFHHNANDMFILYLTDIMLIEGPAGVNAPEANGLSISQNTPNPANGSTTITYTLAQNSDVLFNVTDVTGQVVYTENVANQSSGLHNLELNTANLANGMYFYNFTVNGQVVTRKLVVENK